MSRQSWAYRINRETQLFFPLYDYMAEAVALADPQFDFSNIDAVIVVPPSSTTTMNVSPAFVPNHPVWGLEADGNVIMSGFARGTDWAGNDAEVIYHELGHTLGLVDAYGYGSGFPDLHRFVGIFDPMGNLTPDAGGNEMLAWHRWQLDWIDDDQIYCVEDLAEPHDISAVAVEGGTDAVLVPVSDTKLVAIESRRKVGVDAPLAKEGALVYTIDSAVSSGYGPVEVVGTHGPGGPEADVLLGVGESATVDGVTVTVVAADGNGDTVMVSRP